MNFEEPDTVKLLVTFASDVDLDSIIFALNENYLFIEHVARHGKN
jgi:hypothetical protein